MTGVFVHHPGSLYIPEASVSSTLPRSGVLLCASSERYVRFHSGAVGADVVTGSSLRDSVPAYTVVDGDAKSGTDLVYDGVWFNGHPVYQGGRYSMFITSDDELVVVQDWDGTRDPEDERSVPDPEHRGFVYVGDNYYTVSGLPRTDDDSSLLEPKGPWTHLSDESGDKPGSGLRIRLKFPRYEADEKGVYRPRGGMSGKPFVIGNPQWEVAPDEGDRFTMTRIPVVSVTRDGAGFSYSASSHRYVTLKTRNGRTTVSNVMSERDGRLVYGRWRSEIPKPGASFSMQFSPDDPDSEQRGPVSCSWIGYTREIGFPTPVILGNIPTWH